MKRIGVFLLFVFVWGSALAQRFPADFWHPGEVDLNTGETIVGEIRYDLGRETLQIRVDGVVRSYSASQVAAFQIQDVTSAMERTFFALPFKREDGFASIHFFELLAEGRLTLLVREKLEERVHQFYDPFLIGPQTTRIVELVDDFFIMDPEGEIRMAGRQAESLLPFMENRQEIVRNFIKKNRLNTSKRADLIAVLEFYNGAPK